PGPPPYARLGVNGRFPTTGGIVPTTKQSGRWGSAAKQPNHRPDSARVLGLRARGRCPPIVPQTNSLREEIPMTVRTWARKLFARTPGTIRKAAARCRPHLEALEDRLVPAAFHVTSLLDDGSAGTLRAAITQANANAGADTIDFQVSGTISLKGGDLPAFIDAATTTITGPSGGLKLDAHHASRIFRVGTGATVHLS